jgi:predicted aldo/keto reductase-like oxidoreductase
VYIATKLPQYVLRSLKAVEKTFQEELKRLRTDHIDYYLMHMFTDYSEWESLKSYGIEEWIRSKKEDGSIRQIGFSYHGDSEMFLKILDAYDWDFCQIQYNYMDEHSQAGRKGLQAAAAKGIPVIIMEPLRGGKLVNLPAEAQKAISASGNGMSAAELGLRWLWNQPEVTVVLSGMNSLEMVEENIRIASAAEPGSFSEEENALIERVRGIIKSKEKVGCTGCRYCTKGCPMGIPIPDIFTVANRRKGSPEFRTKREYSIVTQGKGKASECVQCGQCEGACPQHLPIISLLETCRAMED